MCVKRGGLGCVVERATLRFNGLCPLDGTKPQDGGCNAVRAKPSAKPLCCSRAGAVWGEGWEGRPPDISGVSLPPHPSLVG